ncbi:GrpE protein [Chloroherpeton thalassium ATCC 35110]|uniref:Protein GrpE n=1 Tax=Chloroherpeton thalassium (strain ATCC 35110 / GB-78) TaxID=517418 RepID=GRPE_CHLT3|nr:nucleotide exchange factor GrpE [Chloroherpeton thalassium]B3QTT2.1 RecName: Full=Protein GrpE; AltName: Full=HSP-70 cofactor [Chloroherpeton thalassium ATCC 35110]ACF14280.1 GrpE protein [Chloroherpeton thalassium ATCC 35110]
MSEEVKNSVETEENKASKDNATQAPNPTENHNTAQETEKAENSEKTESATQENESLDKLKKDVTNYREQLLRTVADFENLKKQKEREVASVRKFADESLIKELLPVLDDIERVLVNASKFLQASPEAQSYVDGVKLIQQNMMKVFEARGLKRIEAVGTPFDVHLHEALSQMEKEGAEPDTVIQEFAPGYTLNDKVVRHSKVIVSK